MIELSQDSYPIKRSRLVGWYNDKDIATDMVECNDLDINEGGYYSFAVVEKVPEGTYALSSQADDEVWYEWNKTTKKYVSAAKPEALTSIMSFGIG